jgi:exodeoxyribonuclease VII large subunit
VTLGGRRVQILEVSQLTAYLKDLLQSDPILSDVWVRGEISNFTRSAAGHIYFTLKSDSSQLRCVLFRGNARFLTFTPGNGDAILAHGNVSIYEVSGQYQLYVDLIQPEGTGLLQLQFEELRQRLEREGLFDIARKRPLPQFPRCIGVVTSSTGAVWHDIQTVLARRYPLCELILCPAQVQGADAPATIIAALQALQEDGRAEVIIVGRGGGSAEDLACFNDEKVARAIYAASVPVVSAVGHETDFTIADFVADLRAATPSAAAEVVAPHVREMAQQIVELHDRAHDAMVATLREAQAEMDRSLFRMSRVSPESSVRHERQRLDLMLDTMRHRIDGRVNTERSRIAATTREMALLHPQQIMERGYAMVIDRSSGGRVHAASSLSPNQDLLLRFHDGAASATVNEVDQSVSNSRQQPGERNGRE